MPAIYKFTACIVRRLEKLAQMNEPHHSAYSTYAFGYYRNKFRFGFSILAEFFFTLHYTSNKKDEILCERKQRVSSFCLVWKNYFVGDDAHIVPLILVLKFLLLCNIIFSCVKNTCNSKIFMIQ